MNKAKQNEEKKQTANAKPLTDRPTRCHWVKVKVTSRKFKIHILSHTRTASTQSTSIPFTSMQPRQDK